MRGVVASLSAQYGEPVVPFEARTWPEVPVVPFAVTGSARTIAVELAMNEPVAILIEVPVNVVVVIDDELTCVLTDELPT